MAVPGIVGLSEDWDGIGKNVTMSLLFTVIFKKKTGVKPSLDFLGYSLTS